jgi:hypothetical protein
VSETTKRSLITLFFLSQLVAVWLLGGAYGWPTGDDQPGEKEQAIERYGFYLTESAEEAGLVFTHQGPNKLDRNLEHILPLIAMTGASVSVVDYDRDGWLDVFVVNSREGSQCALFRNLGNGKFRDVTKEVGLSGLNNTGSCQGAVWGDYDNDGYEDLLVYKWGRPELYRNVKGKRFERVTEKAKLPERFNANSAVWFDFDRDGHLDLFIAGYWADDVDLWKLKTTRMMPESFEYAKNGGRKYLLRNKGDGTFEDVTAKMGITSTRWTLGVAAADLCGSGYPDLILANDYGISEYYCNKGGEKFVEIGAATGIGDRPKSGMSVCFGDIDNTGRLAMYISNISDKGGNLNQGNNLWVPRPNEAGVPARYFNEATVRKAEHGGWSWGAQFGDLNNDGSLDLFLASGMISASKTDSYWYDYGKIAGADRFIIHDAANWPAIRGRSLSGYEQPHLWMLRGGEYVDVAASVGVRDTHDGRAVALADLGNRGVLDVLVANQNGPLAYYKNSVKPGRHWVQFQLEGTKSNRSAIGAMVRLRWTRKDEEMEQVQVVEGGNGYASQNMRRLHFGLGEDARIIEAVIRWPSGRVQTIKAPKADMLHPIKEANP